MHNNPIVLARFARKLHQKLAGKYLEQCISGSLTDISFLFSNDFYLNIQFVKQHTLLLTPESSHFPNRNTLIQFKSINGKKIVAVHNYFPDRSFGIEFTNNQLLFVQAYGRHSGIVLTQNEQITDFFKFRNKPDSWHIPMSRVDLTPLEDAFIKANPFVNESVLMGLRANDFFSKEILQREIIWNAYLKKLENNSFCINPEPLKLTLFDCPADGIRIEDDFKAHHTFSIKLLSKTRFEELYLSIQSELNKRRKSSEKTLQSALTRQMKMTQSGDYRQMADVLMANLHQIDKRLSEVELFNFYSNRTEIFKLKKDLTAQEYAANLYRKAKNSHLEEANTNTLIKRLKSNIILINSQLEKLTNVTDYRDLIDFQKSLDIKSNKREVMVNTPFKSYKMDGFDIWVGKSAKSNDGLLKLAGKNDMWLHAREVSGSHVLIRNPEQKKIPESTLEYAASLAAGHSKNQHETLAAVIFTPVKYVRKFKGANPGQVRVEREEVLLVEPRKS